MMDDSIKLKFAFLFVIFIEITRNMTNNEDGFNPRKNPNPNVQDNLGNPNIKDRPGDRWRPNKVRWLSFDTELITFDAETVHA